MRLWFPWLLSLLVVVMSGSRNAEAMCATPRGGFSPRAGTVMPARGTAYLFAPIWGRSLREAAGVDDPPGEPTIEVEGARYTSRVVVTSTLYIVVRVDYEATAPRISMRWRESGEPAASYPIGKAAPSSANHATVVKVEHVESSWTCSHNDTIDIALDSNAIAYRLAWVDGTSTVVPADTQILWSHHQDTAEPVEQLIQLGHLNCLGHNVDPTLFASARAFQLFALFADGSEQVFRTAGAMLREGEVRLPHELLLATARPSSSREGLEASASSEPLDAPPRGRLWTLIGSGAVLGGALLTLLLQHLRTRRRDHVPRY